MNTENRFHSSECHNRIIVVEDDEGLNRLIQKRLKADGYQVFGALNGTEAVDMMRESCNAVMLLDYNLPDMSVEQILEELKNAYCTAPFIIMTGHGDETIAVEMMKLGALDYLVKDLHFIDLLPAVVSRVFEEIQTRQRLVDAEKALLDTSRILKLVIEASLMGIISIDCDAKVVLWSPAAQKMFGWEEDEVKNRDVPFVSGQLFDDFRSELHTVLQGRSTRIEMLNCRKKDGSHIDVDLSIAPMMKDTHEIVGATAIIEDITAKRKSEIEKKQLEIQLQQTQKMDAIGTLAGGIAHDFNNILTTVQGYSDLMMMKMDETDPFYRDVKHIRVAASRGATLVKQLLIFSRKQPMAFQVLDLNLVIEDMLKMLNRLIGEDINIATDLEYALTSIKGDEGNIEQVIMNLALNARDAMPNGGTIEIKTNSVYISADDCMGIPDAYDGHFVRLSVSDCGEGMEPAVKDRMFEPFFSTKKAEGGTGLGLSTVYGIVKYHKGWIHAETEPGKGTTFRVYFPVTHQKAEEKQEEHIAIEQFAGNGERVLIVEDDPAIRDISYSTLSENGYVVFDAESAEDALDLFNRENGNFDIVVSDVVLPGKNGLQLVDELLAKKDSLKCILCSGYTDEKAQLSVIRSRGYPYIEKPFTIAHFLKTIQETLQR